jgi:Putative auto-transporter adhesin, head GIN domain
MPRLRLLTLLAAAPAVAVAGCALLSDPGPEQTAQRRIQEVTGVRLQTSGTLSITGGERTSLSVTAGGHVIDRLTSEVHDGVLVLGLDGHVEHLGSVHYSLVVPSLDSLEVDGSREVTALAVAADTMTITLDGSGDITASDVDVTRLDVTLAGSGTVQAAGNADRQSVRVEGSGAYDGTRLGSQHAQVTVAGSGDVRVHATGSLDAVVSGSDDVTYTGDPTVTRRIDGSGDVSGQ